MFLLYNKTKDFAIILHTVQNIAYGSLVLLFILVAVNKTAQRTNTTKDKQ
jgi:hypothetical protein